MCDQKIINVNGKTQFTLRKIRTSFSQLLEAEITIIIGDLLGWLVGWLLAPQDCCWLCCTMGDGCGLPPWAALLVVVVELPPVLPPPLVDGEEDIGRLRGTRGGPNVGLKSS